MVFIKHRSVFSSPRPDSAPRYWFQQRINKISDGTGGHHRMCFGLGFFFFTFITGSILFLPFEAERGGWRCSTLLRRGVETEHPSSCCSSLFHRQYFADVPSDEKRQTGGGEVPFRARRATTPPGLLRRSPVLTLPGFARRATTGSKTRRCVAHRVLYV